MRDSSRVLSASMVAVSSFLAGCAGLAGDDATTAVAGPIKGGDHGDFQITSPAFADGAPIPDENTCNGKPFGSGTSPALEWANAPQHTMSRRHPVGAARAAGPAARAQPAAVVNGAPRRAGPWSRMLRAHGPAPADDPRLPDRGLRGAPGGAAAIGDVRDGALPTAAL